MARKQRPAEPRRVTPDAVDPRHAWDRPLQAPGHMQVDFEERVDFRRLHGAVSPKAGLFTQAAREIKAILGEEGVVDMPLGIDVVEPPFLFALQEAGVRVSDGQQVMLEARALKSADELALLNMAAAMVDGVYQDIAEALRPGVRENEIVALATQRLYAMGSDCVEAINAISGERCSPHPHNFTDRLVRPGDQAFFDIIQSFVGYRTCYYRTFSVGRATAAQVSAYKKAREWMDEAIALIKPGVTTDRIARAFPKAPEIGFESEMAAFGLNFCHGLGLGLHERPIISRLNSFDDPMELQAGMVFAVETYCPATDGVSAARIEEEVIVMPKGAQARGNPGGQRGPSRHRPHQAPQARRERPRPPGRRRHPLERRLRARALHRGAGNPDAVPDQLRRRPHPAPAAEVADPYRLLGRRQHAPVRRVRGHGPRVQEGRDARPRLRVRLGDGRRVPQGVRG